MNYLLDTNMLVIYGRDSKISNQIEKEIQLFRGKHNLGISVVTIGELNSLEKQFGYGKKRKLKLEKLISGLFKIGINTKRIIERYGEIDAFSQNKLKNNPLRMTSRNMGKNDLWIAATASVYGMTLITTDKDFSI